MCVLNRCFIVLFMAMLTLPLIFADLSSNRVSVQENRMLADRPKIADIKSRPGRFIRDFDDWFKDSTGFRKQLLALYNVMEMNLKIGGVLYKEGQAFYLIGEHGHHFYAGENYFLIRSFQGEQILSDGQLANLASKFEEVKAYLDEKGIPFVIMLCTVKESIYPEFYPKSIKRRPEPTQFDIITDYLREHTSIDVFNIRRALTAEKDNYLLYPVSYGDLSHYTEIGAFFAYRELMKHINIYFPDIVPYGLNDIDITYDKKFGNILEPDVTLKKEITYKKLDPSFFDGVEFREQPVIWENVAYENKNTDLPVILVFRDSFFGFFTMDYEKRFITQFIASHFGKAVFIHWLNFKHFEEYVAKFKPDIVLFESVESNIGNFAKIIAGLPELTTVRGGSNEK